MRRCQLLAGAIATAFEVGRTPHFVDFRNFKVSSKVPVSSHIDSPAFLCLVGRDRLAGFSSHHRPYHNHHAGLVFVSSFSSVCQSAY